MKKLLLSLFIILNVTIVATAQTYLTRNGKITFYSHTPIEDIKAENNEVASSINTATGDMDFRVGVRGFRFKKAAMEEHFNEPDYMDSEKYPRASFKGKITNAGAVNFSKDGTYKVTVAGDMTIKGVTKPVTAQGTITVSGGKIKASSTFNIKRKDFNVIGKAFVQNKIAEELQITVDCEYDKM